MSRYLGPKIISNLLSLSRASFCSILPFLSQFLLEVTPFLSRKITLQLLTLWINSGKFTPFPSLLLLPFRPSCSLLPPRHPHQRPTQARVRSAQSNCPLHPYLAKLKSLNSRKLSPYSIKVRFPSAFPSSSDERKRVAQLMKEGDVHNHTFSIETHSQTEMELLLLVNWELL